MFRRKKKDEPTDAPATPVETTPAAEVPAEAMSDPASVESAPVTMAAAPSEMATTEAVSASESKGTGSKTRRGNRVQKVGTVASDKMQKTVIVRVDRQVRHPKYRRYVRRTSKFMAHDDLGSTIGDRVRIVETRPLSAKKRWRVVEIVQKAAK